MCIEHVEDLSSVVATACISQAVFGKTPHTYITYLIPTSYNFLLSIPFALCLSRGQETINPSLPTPRLVICQSINDLDKT